MVYTPAAASASGNINSLINSSRSTTNNICANSGANASVNIVYSTQLSYTESGNLQFDVIELQDNDGNDPLDVVHSLRDQYGADVVVLLVAPPGNACGWAYGIKVGVNGAFAVVRTDCAVNNYSFAHEVGHLIGGRHDDETEGSYDHGYFKKGNNWKTVMAVDKPDRSAPRIPYWSNPNKTYNGQPMGTTNWNDVTRVWNERTGVVAGFKSPPFTVSISGPSLAPCATGTWTANVSNGTSPYSYQWYHMWDCNGAGPGPTVPCNTWTAVGTNSSTLQMYLCGGNSILRVDVTDGQGRFATDQHYVYGSGSGFASQKSETSAEGLVTVPEQFSLSQNYPNPFNPETEIVFAVPESSTVRIAIMVVLGREVATIADGQFVKGYHRVRWSGKNMAGQPVGSGIYFYRMVATNDNGQQFTKIMRMLLLK